MPRIAYVNGRYVRHDQARVHIEDRGYQFADGVYEVVAVEQGRFVDEAGHLARLHRSLRELQIDCPVSLRVLGAIMRQIATRNRIRNGTVYIQITRGVAPREFYFPQGVTPSLVLTGRSKGATSAAPPPHGIRVITIPDIRWKRRDIKSVSLLPQVLGKQKAVAAGATEAWQVDDDGTITEGCSSNAWIVTGAGTLTTRMPSNRILNGITRRAIIRIAGEEGIPFEERAFEVAEALEAREAFLTSSSSFVMPVTQIDDTVIADGRPGPLARRLRRHYEEHATGLRKIARSL